MVRFINKLLLITSKREILPLPPRMADAGILWLFRYESPDFKEQIEKVWSQVTVLYEELYGYVRHRLRTVYPH